jgi:SAM-dependent methyltransferase
MYWDNLDRHAGGGLVEEMWLANRIVREAVNARIAGDPGRWPLDWFSQAYRERLPFGEALSLGCGAGALERDLLARGICRRITGIDVAGPPLEKAREDAAAAGMAGRISYLQADGREVLAHRAGQLDAVFFHGSLHHFDRLDDLLRLVASALKPGGLLYADEYIGPSRDQWHPLRLLLPNLAYYTLPPSVRRVGRIRAPINHEDPTESVASHEIVKAIGRTLKILERRDYGGNLLCLVYPNLKREAAELDRAVRRLLAWEDAVLKMARSHHTLIVAERR